MKKLEALMEVSKGEEVVCYMVEVYMHRRAGKTLEQEMKEDGCCWRVDKRWIVLRFLQRGTVVEVMEARALVVELLVHRPGFAIMPRPISMKNKPIC